MNILIIGIAISVSVLVFLFVSNDIYGQTNNQVIECTVKGTLAPKYPKLISGLEKKVILECEEKNPLTNVIQGDKVRIMIKE
jgi:hypothetical protein